MAARRYHECYNDGGEALDKIRGAEVVMEVAQDREVMARCHARGNTGMVRQR